MTAVVRQPGDPGTTHSKPQRDDLDDFADPIAVRVGMFVGVDDLPCDGWPDEFKESAVRRILQALSVDD